jgi:hypothetical protein
MNELPEVDILVGLEEKIIGVDKLNIFKLLGGVITIIKLTSLFKG